MFTLGGQEQKRSNNRLPDPPPNREHPKDSSFRHRQGKAIKDSDGRIIGRDSSEQVIKVRGINVKGLDARRSDADKGLPVFVKSRHFTDERIDRPVPTPIGVHVPAKWSTRSVSKSGLRARLS